MAGPMAKRKAAPKRDRIDVFAHNRAAWDREAALANPWTIPASPAAIAEARAGLVEVKLTNSRVVPRAWLPADLRGVRVLALASGGGQQAPILAAAGAVVTVLDASPAQLAQDRTVAAREKLALRVEEGDMADLSRFADGSFDLVLNPASTLFVPDVLPVWRECHRVLRAGGTLLAGFLNPATYLFDRAQEADGVLVATHALPYRDVDLPKAERERLFGKDAPLEFSHSLEALVGGQLAAGFHLVDLYEDRYGDGSALDRAMPALLATRAWKPV